MLNEILMKKSGSLPNSPMLDGNVASTHSQIQSIVEEPNDQPANNQQQ
jgi:hypothetical protein